jgi:ornithine cyclodeaminase
MASAGPVRADVARRAARGYTAGMAPQPPRAATPPDPKPAPDVAPRFLDAAAVRAATPWPALIAAIAEAFRAPHVAPDRHIHEIAVPGEPEATALLMPAWIEGKVYGVKLANIMPGNGARGLPSVHAVYALFDGRSGAPLAIMDGGEITARRTAATSALVADRLARRDARTLLAVGAGRIARLAVEAHGAVRDYARVAIWAREPARAAAAAAALSATLGRPVEAAADLDAAVAEADVISAATLSEAPLIRGARLKPGCHLDLVGAFRPSMRECDAEAVRRARVFIDTLGGAQAEAGDLIRAEAEGAFRWADVAGDLVAIASGAAGRRGDAEITLFKSVGAAIEDLAAARLVRAADDATRRDAAPPGPARQGAP